ncbi:peptide-methionine (R)-S-oxide reductase MsrB [Candidatus Berkelbacteria bacterium]|nr:peptide-methionine (R)-S-oxide reductase MsrB [Candidatus Berkelbacteria bacterium]
MLNKSEKDWREQLTPEQFEILRLKGTDAPFSGEFVDFDEKGVYSCAACGKRLFMSDTKYDSHCGWPSFYDVANSGSIELTRDSSHGMIRTEVTCKNCGGHLGHLFDDGPQDKGGKRYCINSTSLKFNRKQST